MTQYSKTGPFTNGAAPAISAQFLNNVETALAALIIPAPAPSGGDDTATLQALLNTAQATGGTLMLQAGTYQANLATQQSFQQPRLVGQGKDQTIIQATVNTAPVVRYKGGSGSLAGGLIQDITVQAGSSSGGVGVELADCGGVELQRVRITGALAEGLRFHSESSGAFCEFNRASVEIQQGPVLAVHYKVTSGNPSFHGTGLISGTVINQSSSSTSPMVQIDAGCIPYNAPMTATFFPRQTGGVIILNNSTDIADFYGNLDIEVQVTGPTTVASTAGSRVWLAGTVTGLAASNLRLGNLYLVDRSYYVQGSRIAQYRPLRRATTLASGTTTIFGDNIGSCLAQVDVIGSNYHYSAVLHCWQSPYNSGGTVTQIANPYTNNSAGLGAPTFAWSNYGLTITNSNYSSSVSAYVAVNPLPQIYGVDALGQY